MPVINTKIGQLYSIKDNNLIKIVYKTIYNDDIDHYENWFVQTFYENDVVLIVQKENHRRLKITFDRDLTVYSAYTKYGFIRISDYELLKPQFSLLF